VIRRRAADKRKTEQNPVPETAPGFLLAGPMVVVSYRGL
jgi:hypothetical protein